MADNFMQFIVSIAQRCSEEGVQFRFTSPDGFPLIQPYVQKDKIGPVELPFRDNILNVILKENQQCQLIVILKIIQS